jgi:hypothetical protein
VYGLLNRAGEVIYVGSTARPVRLRLGEHRHGPLHNEIARLVVLASGFRDGAAMRAAERAEIWRRRPKYNRQYNPDVPKPVANQPDLSELVWFEKCMGLPPGSAYFTPGPPIGIAFREVPDP